LLRTVEQEKANVISMVGDAMGRPLAEALAGPLAGTESAACSWSARPAAILSEAVRTSFRRRCRTC